MTDYQRNKHFSFCKIFSTSFFGSSVFIFVSHVILIKERWDNVFELDFPAQQKKLSRSDKELSHLICFFVVFGSRNKFLEEENVLNKDRAEIFFFLLIQVVQFNIIAMLIYSKLDYLKGTDNPMMSFNCKTFRFDLTIAKFSFFLRNKFESSQKTFRSK